MLNVTRSNCQLFQHALFIKVLRWDRPWLESLFLRLFMMLFLCQGWEPGLFHPPELICCDSPEAAGSLFTLPCKDLHQPPFMCIWSTLWEPQRESFLTLPFPSEHLPVILPCHWLYLSSVCSLWVFYRPDFFHRARIWRPWLSQGGQLDEVASFENARSCAWWPEALWYLWREIVFDLKLLQENFFYPLLSPHAAARTYWYLRHLMLIIIKAYIYIYMYICISPT